MKLLFTIPFADYFQQKIHNSENRGLIGRMQGLEVECSELLLILQKMVLIIIIIIIQQQQSCFGPRRVTIVTMKVVLFLVVISF